MSRKARRPSKGAPLVRAGVSAGAPSQVAAPSSEVARQRSTVGLSRVMCDRVDSAPRARGRGRTTRATDSDLGLGLGHGLGLGLELGLGLGLGLGYSLLIARQSVARSAALALRDLSLRSVGRGTARCDPARSR